MSGNEQREPRLGARSLSRERALQALYQVDLAGADPKEALRAAWASGEIAPDAKSAEFAERLVCGAVAERAALDALIERYSHHWRIERMSRIDRNVLRLATFELLRIEETPARVVLNEGIELAKRFGSETSGAFINGILDRIAAHVAQSASTPALEDDEAAPLDGTPKGADSPTDPSDAPVLR